MGLWSCADIKKSYVDVLNPGGAGPGPGPAPAPAVLGPSVPLQPPPSYFVPAPLPQVPLARHIYELCVCATICHYFQLIGNEYNITICVASNRRICMSDKPSLYYK